MSLNELKVLLRVRNAWHLESEMAHLLWASRESLWWSACASLYILYR